MPRSSGYIPEVRDGDTVPYTGLFRVKKGQRIIPVTKLRRPRGVKKIRGIKKARKHFRRR